MQSSIDTEKLEAEHIDEAQGSFYFGQLSENLSAARQLWRRYPDLVESPTYPEAFLSEWMRFHKGEGTPDDEGWTEGEEELVEKGILRPAEPRNTLTLHEIRKLTHSYSGLPYKAKNAAINQKLAASFSTSDSDEKELAHLARCQAVYRRESEACQEADPTAHLLVFITDAHCTRTLDHDFIAAQLEEAAPDWRDRDNILAIAKEDEEIEGLYAHHDEVSVRTGEKMQAFLSTVRGQL